MSCDETQDDGPDAAVNALFADQLEDMDEESAADFKQMMLDEYKKCIDIRAQAAQVQVDELLPAGDLREQLAGRLETLRGKRRTERDRYHGTMLF